MDLNYSHNSMDCVPPTFFKNRTATTLVNAVANLVSNNSVQQRLKAHGLQCQAVAWEDTSRTKGSCWGDNITDMTLKVDSTRMPIIRSPNFTDTTVDLAADKLPLLVVGNDDGSLLRKVTLREYLENFEKYCGTECNRTNLYHSRDQHVLTSAQACVLPVESGKVDFAVDLYNYQSCSEPAVLVIMATAYGTSAQVVCSGNSVLYFNSNGTNRPFRAERLSDHRTSQGKSVEGSMTSEEKALNGIYIFQVPLKVTQRKPRGIMKHNSCVQECAMMDTFSSENKYFPRGMERAVLTLGEEKGSFKGILNDSGRPYKLERDTDKPVRLTVQFYMCSDNDQIADENIDDICGQIRRIYEQGLNEGSLVVDHAVPKPGLLTKTQAVRPTTSGPSHLNNSIL